MVKLKCPYCNKQIQHAITVDGHDFYWCENYDCDSSSEMVGTEEMWATVIDAEKKLDTERSALKYIAGGNLGLSPAIQDFAEKAVEQINKKEEQ